MEDNFNELNFYIHIRKQNYKGRKCYTIVDGIPEEFDYKKIVRHWRKMYNCGGDIKEDEGTHKEYIRLTGDHRQEISKFLEEEGIAPKENIKVHGAD